MLESAAAAAAATMDADSYLGPALVVVIVQSFSYTMPIGLALLSVLASTYMFILCVYSRGPSACFLPILPLVASVPNGAS